uniref:Uncharacterized protein n=1 Tax=Globodera rostochiensis TaxID=31243 RepID=A0A914I0S7_GLORO
MTAIVRGQQTSQTGTEQTSPIGQTHRHGKDFDPGDTVWIREPDGKWAPGILLQPVGERIWEAQLEGSSVLQYAMEEDVRTSIEAFWAKVEPILSSQTKLRRRRKLNLKVRSQTRRRLTHQRVEACPPVVQVDPQENGQAGKQRERFEYPSRNGRGRAGYKEQWKPYAGKQHKRVNFLVRQLEKELGDADQHGCQCCCWSCRNNSGFNNRRGGGGRR